MSDLVSREARAKLSIWYKEATGTDYNDDAVTVRRLLLTLDQKDGEIEALNSGLVELSARLEEQQRAHEDRLWFEAEAYDKRAKRVFKLGTGWALHLLDEQASSNQGVQGQACAMAARYLRGLEATESVTQDPPEGADA